MSKLSNPDYLAKVKLLSQEERERLMSRMNGKLPRRLEKDKISQEEALAIQMEVEDEHLEEWRKVMRKLQETSSAKEAPLAVKKGSKAEKVDKEVEAPKVDKTPKKTKVEKPAKPAKKSATAADVQQESVKPEVALGSAAATSKPQVEAKPLPSTVAAGTASDSNVGVKKASTSKKAPQK